jgi:hypothetical protein
MSATAVLNTLHRMGLTIRVEGEKLIVQPKEAITDEVRTLIRAHKPDLLVKLAANDATDCADVNGRIEEACRGLTITPAKFKCFLDGFDFNEIRSGEWTLESMRLYAEIWASGKGYLH